ncbi:MAG: glycosyltransferase [Acidobacteriota bacterium]
MVSHRVPWLTVELSVIVTSYESPQTLRTCLESLTGQPEAGEIWVADCSAVNPQEILGPLFPGVRFLHFEGVRSVPALRWAAYFATRGDLVAAVEARCIPSARWCAEIIDAHRRFPETPAIGGPVDVASPATGADLGLYFCEYGLFLPPGDDTGVPAISGANLSYKRAALEEARDLLQAGEWETLLHARWLQSGRMLRFGRATVVFENTMTAETALRQRFHYGRGYAGDRLRGRGLPVRLLFGLGTAALPALLLWRLTAAAARSGRGRDFLRALPWTVLFCLAWSLGELAGYLSGPPRRARIF